MSHYQQVLVCKAVLFLRYHLFSASETIKLIGNQLILMKFGLEQYQTHTNFE